MSSKILACVTSVSARVRRKNWDESKKRVTPSPFIPLFCSRLSSQFYRRTRAETLATQATKIQPVAEFSRNRLFVINICNGMCIPKTFCVSQETTRTPTVRPVDCLRAAFLSFVLRGSRFFFFIWTNLSHGDNRETPKLAYKIFVHIQSNPALRTPA